MTSKQQEMEILQKIKKLVESLGDNSYIATAFEGCFEVAEENIKNDFACSMKQRAEAAEKEAESYKKQLDEETKHSEEIERVALERAEKIKELHSKILSDDDIDSLSYLVKKKICEVEEQLGSAAEKIVQYAENSTSDEFKIAVKKHRANQSLFEKYRALDDRLNNDATA